VKATSGCNVLAGPLLAGQPGMRVILLDMPLEPYLATLLKSETSVADAATAAAERLQVLVDASSGVPAVALHALSLPQQCAMGWLAERLRFQALGRGAHGQRVLRVDFETLLGAPAETLAAVADHLGLDAGGTAQAMEAPAWQRYSKAQAHAYGARDRQHDLALSRERHGAAIGQGVEWVEDFLARHAALRGGLDGGGL
ncbi:MAG: hypothetical protein M3Q40_04260, partial [Pseudomonadota bacterium]|nr:hypothetical protein [Pseudomonadota bacterium]